MAKVEYQVWARIERIVTGIRVPIGVLEAAHGFSHDACIFAGAPDAVSQAIAAGHTACLVYEETEIFEDVGEPVCIGMHRSCIEANAQLAELDQHDGFSGRGAMSYINAREQDSEDKKEGLNAAT